MSVEQLQEYTIARGNKSLTIDREKGIVRNVKILGVVSANGRRYPAETLRNAAALYEGAKVNADHSDQPGRSRSVRDRMGKLSGIRLEADGLYADEWRFNPKGILAEDVFWAAEHAPDTIGMSHTVDAKTGRDRGGVVVEEIIKVYSVDVVADPATTKGLHEQRESKVSATIHETLGTFAAGSTIFRFLKEMDDAGMGAVPVDVPKTGSSDDQIWAAFRAAVMNVVDDEELDMKATLKKVKDILGAYEKVAAKVGGSSDEAGETPIPESIQGQVKALREELDGFRAREALAAKREKIDRKLTEAKLPKEAITDIFREQCLAADDTSLAKLIEDRQQLAKGLRSGKPLSRGPEPERVTEQVDSKAWAHSLKSN